MPLKGLGLLLFALSCSVACTASAKTIYKIDQIFPMKGKAPSWDYITEDTANGRLFLGRRAAGVTVFGLSAKREIGHIEHSDGANSAVLVPEFDRGYTINGDGTTTIFALSNLKTITREKIGNSADNAVFDPVTKQLVVIMGDDKLITFLDAKTGKVIGTLKMEAEELEGAAPDGKGMLFIAERDINKIAKIDIAKRIILAEYDATGCTQPTGLAYDATDGRIFAGCKGETPVLLVMDSVNGKIVAKEPIGRGNDGVAYDRDDRRVFTTNGIDGNLVIYNQVTPDKYTLMQAVTTRPIARTIALDPKTKTIFTMTAEGAVDPAKKRNLHAGAFYPNTFFDDTFTLLAIGPHKSSETVTKAADD